MVALCSANFDIASSDGFGVLPSGRVIITVCETSGSVSSLSRAAAAAKNELTPGIISKDIFSLFSIIPSARQQHHIWKDRLYEPWQPVYHFLHSHP